MSASPRFTIRWRDRDWRIQRGDSWPNLSAHFILSVASSSLLPAVTKKDLRESRRAHENLLKEYKEEVDKTARQHQRIVDGFHDEIEALRGQATMPTSTDSNYGLGFERDSSLSRFVVRYRLTTFRSDFLFVLSLQPICALRPTRWPTCAPSVPPFSRRRTT